MLNRYYEKSEQFDYFNVLPEEIIEHILHIIAEDDKTPSINYNLNALSRFSRSTKKYYQIVNNYLLHVLKTNKQPPLRQAITLSIDSLFYQLNSFFIGYEQQIRSNEIFLIHNWFTRSWSKNGINDFFIITWLNLVILLLLLIINDLLYPLIDFQKMDVSDLRSNRMNPYAMALGKITLPVFILFLSMPTCFLSFLAYQHRAHLIDYYSEEFEQFQKMDLDKNEIFSDSKFKEIYSKTCAMTKFFEKMQCQNEIDPPLLALKKTIQRTKLQMEASTYMPTLFKPKRKESVLESFVNIISQGLGPRSS